MTPHPELLHSARAVRLWLAVVIAMVFSMVVVGGITRLTGSGLSMVEWEPIMGVVPPLSDADWHAAFEAYKQYPQYRLTHPDMDLSGFQGIFFWEYVHRVLGRTIGLVFAVPFFWFLARGAFARPLALRLGIALFLGGLQGFVGWLMVKSGLVDEPRVSHFRLAAHLGLALTIIAYLGWVLLSLRPRGSTAPVGQAGIPRPLLRLLTILVGVQIIYGAFVAGLRAGWGYNTFPRMGDRWIAEAVMAMDPWWVNLLEDHATVQFLHRVLGTLLVVAVGAVWLRYRNSARDRVQRHGLDVLLGLLLAQYALGVYTLVNVVPLVPAVMHQGCAALIVLALVAVLSRSSSPWALEKAPG
jgi:cytochrome c oxidase assembly protein subunit 15